MCVGPARTRSLHNPEEQQPQLRVHEEENIAGKGSETERARSYRSLARLLKKAVLAMCGLTLRVPDVARHGSTSCMCCQATASASFITLEFDQTKAPHATNRPKLIEWKCFILIGASSSRNFMLAR